MDDIPTDQPPASEGIPTTGSGSGEEIRRPDGSVLRPVRPESEARGGLEGDASDRQSDD